MMHSNYILKNTFLLLLTILFSCRNNAENKSVSPNEAKTATAQEPEIVVGAAQPEVYLPMLKGKKVAVVSNQTGIVTTTENTMHIVDFLLANKVNITRIFAPEHGFRGTADAGEHVKDNVDTKTGLPIISLYGNHKKPTAQDLEGVDVVIFDIQDVGVRFYTYISTLHYVMEACAAYNKQLIVFDRPNPNGHIVDGPILESQHKSFVGMHPIPVLHGMTIGEYATMINGEGWLENNLQCDVKVIACKNYTHQTPYELPVKPSPNLPNYLSIQLYPSLCFFEGTNISVGRGTHLQFQQYGAPSLAGNYKYYFIPMPNEGAKHPKFEAEKCYGKQLTFNDVTDNLNLNWVIDAYQHTNDKKSFFNSFFTKLAGTEQLQKQIEAGKDIATIRATWQKGLLQFKTTRSKYLLYP